MTKQKLKTMKITHLFDGIDELKMCKLPLTGNAKTFDIEFVEFDLDKNDNRIYIDNPYLSVVYQDHHEIRIYLDKEELANDLGFFVKEYKDELMMFDGEDYFDLFHEWQPTQKELLSFLTEKNIIN